MLSKLSICEAAGSHPKLAVTQRLLETHFAAYRPSNPPLCIAGEELFASSAWQTMLSKLSICESSGSHPKLAVTQRLLESHFASHPPSTRVMVFTSLRDSVVEITAALAHVPSVRPYRFVGQASKKGDDSRKGLSQMKQRQVRTLPPPPGCSHTPVPFCRAGV
jgi:hypothetical protein